MRRKFTKYPQGYVRADSVENSYIGHREISSQEFDQLVDAYKDSDAGWSLIVAELKGTYGLDIAKNVADCVCYERRWY